MPAARQLVCGFNVLVDDDHHVRRLWRHCRNFQQPHRDDSMLLLDALLISGLGASHRHFLWRDRDLQPRAERVPSQEYAAYMNTPFSLYVALC